MGSINIDLTKQERLLERLYPLDTYEGIYALLNNIHRIRAMRFERADFDACNMLIDFRRALWESGLTERQRQVLFFVFEMDMTQQEVADMLGITQQAISFHVKEAIERIAEYNRTKEVETSV